MLSERASVTTTDGTRPTVVTREITNSTIRIEVTIGTTDNIQEIRVEKNIINASKIGVDRRNVVTREIHMKNE